MTAPQVHVSTQLQLGGLEEPPKRGAARRGGSPRPDGQRGPKGARVGDVVIAEGSRWLVESLDTERRTAICRLLGGGAYRRFRARAIRDVERTPTRTESPKPSVAVMEPNHPEDRSP
jgi:hypothetical protein